MSTSNLVVEAKSRALRAARSGDLPAARTAVNDVRDLGGTTSEIAFMFGIDDEQPDAVLQREIASVLAGRRGTR